MSPSKAWTIGSTLPVVRSKRITDILSLTGDRKAMCLPSGETTGEAISEFWKNASTGIRSAAQPQVTEHKETQSSNRLNPGVRLLCIVSFRIGE